MGKKKPQKTKELSVAIAEASSTVDETRQQQSQPQTQPQAPRKRGRPRKIIVKIESEEKKAPPIEQPEAASIAIAAQGTECSMKKGKANEEEQHEGSSSACTRNIATQEGVSSEEMQLPKGEPSRTRARRKSTPRKSS